jgi:hypothetical protein
VLHPINQILLPYSTRVGTCPAPETHGTSSHEAFQIIIAYRGIRTLALAVSKSQSEPLYDNMFENHRILSYICKAQLLSIYKHIFQHNCRLGCITGDRRFATKNHSAILPQRQNSTSNYIAAWTTILHLQHPWSTSWNDFLWHSINCKGKKRPKTP